MPTLCQASFLVLNTAGNKADESPCPTFSWWLKEEANDKKIKDSKIYSVSDDKKCYEKRILEKGVECALSPAV